MTFNIKFHGIPKGSPFAIEVAQGALLADGSVPYWGEPTPGASATIKVTRSNQRIAPEGMIFGVDLVGFDTPGPVEPDGYNPQHHDIHYFWDFGDEGSRYDNTVNVLPHQRDANKMSGCPAAHCYASPGSYTVSVLVIEPSSGKIATATLDLSGEDAVKDPDVEFAGPFTIYVDPDGDFSKAPAGSYHRWSLADAFERIWQRGGPGQYSRIMLAAGKTFDIGSFRWRGGRDWKHIRVCGQDKANPSILKKPIGNGSVGVFWMQEFGENSTVDVVLHDFVIKGTWDELTETPEGDPIPGIYLADTPPSYLWSHNVVFDGCDSGISMDNPNYPSRALGFTGCTFKSWLNFCGFIRSKSEVAFVGNLMARSSDALAGGRKFLHNVHGPFRHQVSTNLILAQNDMFTNSGWFPNIFPYYTQQPCARLFQSGDSTGPSNIWANTMEGGFQCMAAARQDGGRGCHIQNYLIDGNLFIGSHMTETAISVEMGGGTIRNNVFVNPNVPRITGIYHPDSFIRGGPPSLENTVKSTQEEVDQNRAGPVKVYNNTYANLTTSGNRPVSTLAGFDTILEENNVYHEPNAGSGNTAFTPLDTAPLFQARTNGLRQCYEVIPVTIGSDIPVNGNLVIGYAAGRSASDYPATTGQSHEVEINDREIFRHTDDDFSIVFGTSEITITNTSGAPWAAGESIVALYSKQSPAPNDMRFASPMDFVATYAPLKGSSALGSADESLVAVADFYGNLRPAYPSRGAFEMKSS